MTLYARLIPKTYQYLYLWTYSAAFDTIDHGVLLYILCHHFGITDVTLDWFRCTCLIAPRSFSIISRTSKAVNLTCSVPQGSVIGQKKFVVYTEDITEKIYTFVINHHLYSDDAQLQSNTSIADALAGHPNTEVCHLLKTGVLSDAYNSMPTTQK